MISDDSYCSDTCTDIKTNCPNSSTNVTKNPSKFPVQKPTCQTNRRRPIPRRPNNQNSVNPPVKKITPIKSSSKLKKKFQFEINSDSSSYYDYESESDNEDLPVPRAISRPKRPIKQVIKQSENQPLNQLDNQTFESSNIQISNNTPQNVSPRKQKSPEKIINLNDTSNIVIQNNKYLDSSSSSDVCEFYEDVEIEYQDTDEEPQMCEQILNLIKQKMGQNIDNPQSCNENIDTSNSLDHSSCSNVCTIENIKYHIICTKTQASRYTFKLYSCDQCLMTATTSNMKKSVDFKVPELFEEEDLIVGTMSVTKNKKQFILNCNGKEVMTANISSIKNPYSYDRYFTIDIKNPDTNKIEIALKSMLPKVKPDGKLAKKMRKFAVLADHNNKKLIFVRKIRESKIEIEASPLIKDDLKVFAFGIISWISRH